MEALNGFGTACDGHEEWIPNPPMFSVISPLHVGSAALGRVLCFVLFYIGKPECVFSLYLCAACEESTTTIPHLSLSLYPLLFELLLSASTALYCAGH